MDIGTRVRLVGVPENLPNPSDLPAEPVFAKCLGHEFVVAGLNDLGMAELIVESVTGRTGETIWVEPEFLEILS